VLALGYGESATGYIPTARQIEEGDENLGNWYWVSETAEAVLSDGLRQALLEGEPERDASPASASRLGSSGSPPVADRRPPPPSRSTGSP
jgi:hypothetical protein